MSEVAAVSMRIEKKSDAEHKKYGIGEGAFEFEISGLDRIDGRGTMMRMTLPPLENSVSSQKVSEFHIGCSVASYLKDWFWISSTQRPPSAA
jgi:hypothetical protein